MAQLIPGYVGIKDQRSRTTNKEYFLFSRVSFCYSTDKDCWSCSSQRNASTRIFVCLFLFNFLSLQQTITTSSWNTFRVGICFLAHNISTIWLKISWCLNQIWGKFGLSSMIGKFNFAKYFITQRLLWEGMTQQKRANTKNSYHKTRSGEIMFSIMAHNRRQRWQNFKATAEQLCFEMLSPSQPIMKLWWQEGFMP